ncbi:hypothetical protein R3P38DRAFT_2788414 [Favolaschia claudopus]|uniref:Uncharacterized protein n=1 Tax=Favolaschia claudopus TaxID=2862362 RepID=A0AAW0AKV1_9AGAR
MTKKQQPFECGCGCGTLIRTKVTEQRHLAGKGPLYIQYSQAAVNHPPPVSTPSPDPILGQPMDLDDSLALDPPDGILQFNGYHGQLRLLLLIKLEPTEVLHNTTTKFHLLAVVARSTLVQKNRPDMPHTKGMYHSTEIIDASDLEFLVGRVPDRGEYVFIQKIGCDKVLEAHDDPEQRVVPRNSRQKRAETAV